MNELLDRVLIEFFGDKNFDNNNSVNLKPFHAYMNFMIHVIMKLISDNKSDFAAELITVIVRTCPKIILISSNSDSDSADTDTSYNWYNCELIYFSFLCAFIFVGLQVLVIFLQILT